MRVRRELSIAGNEPGGGGRGEQGNRNGRIKKEQEQEIR